MEDSEWDIIGKDELDEKQLQNKKHSDWMKKMDCKTTRLYIDPKKKEEQEWKWLKKKKKLLENPDLKIEDDEELKETNKEWAERILMRLKEIDP